MSPTASETYDSLAGAKYMLSQQYKGRGTIKISSDPDSSLPSTQYGEPVEHYIATLTPRRGDPTIVSWFRVPKRNPGSRELDHVRENPPDGRDDVQKRSGPTLKYVQTFSVTGEGYFPTPMLVSDHAFPYPGMAKKVISDAPTGRERRARPRRGVLMQRYATTKQKRSDPNAARWRAFDWSVSDLQTQKLDTPLKYVQTIRIRGTGPFPADILSIYDLFPTSERDIGELDWDPEYDDPRTITLRRYTASKDGDPIKLPAGWQFVGRFGRNPEHTAKAAAPRSTTTPESATR
jgi:hypothetical protein